jgi:uncharacterized RDD family membrane protein YckC
MSAPTLGRRLACNLYESLLLVAILFVATFPLVGIIQKMSPENGAILLRIYLLLVSGIYFSVFWRRGQTLAMKTWHIKLLAKNGQPLSVFQVWLRFFLACLNLSLLGIGWWAALLREDKQFLQDHWAGTRLERL